jgi:uncharacterized protein YodC (DUF2158 family)
MEELKVGDVVRLKSGGPKMTVMEFKWNPLKNIYETDKPICVWFDGTKKYQDNFVKEMLLKEE